MVLQQPFINSLSFSNSLYSAPSIFAVFRNLVREIWFEKSGSRIVVLKTRIFFLVREKWLTRKKGGFIKEWPGKMIYLNFDSIFGDFFLKFFEEEVSDYLS